MNTSDILKQILLLWDNDSTNYMQIVNDLFENREEESEMLMIVACTSSGLKHAKIPTFFEEWLPDYLNYDFFQLFRMTRRTFVVLLANIDCPELHKTYEGGGYPVSAEKQLMMTLYWLGKGEVLFSIADRFNVSVSTVYVCTTHIVKKLMALAKIYIVWPNDNELINIEAGFREKSNYPGVIGAIDGTCIPFKPPSEQQESYIDKNLNHSIKVQGIVTSQKIFTNIMVGFPGSVHDSRVLRNSSIFIGQEENPRKYFSREDYHLIGDKVYPLKTWLITPYKDNGFITPMQRRHNTAHSKTRLVVEHTFGLLKCRWRILHYINVNSVKKAVNIITACCVLHNFCYVNTDVWSEYEEADVLFDDEEANAYIDNDPEIALLKRQEIARQL